MDSELLEKYEKLKTYIASMESVAVAFSSGVDSSFLLYAAKDALSDKVIAVTASAPSFPKRELNEAFDYCDLLQVKQFVLDFDELNVAGFKENSKERCYYCKRALFEKILDTAKKQNIREVLEGSNLDDMGDYRPGLKAVDELGIKSPLRELGFTKAQIRELSRHFDIPCWNKPSYACLASRFPYGDEISEEKLGMVDRAEQLLLDLGFKQMRVRIHGDMARIELETADFDRFMKEDVRGEVYRKFREYGFSYIALDIRGFRSGSMNENILTKAD